MRSRATQQQWVQWVKTMHGPNQGAAGRSHVHRLCEVPLTTLCFQRTLSRCWSFAPYLFLVVLSCSSPAWLTSSSGRRDGACKMCSFWMKGAIEMEVSWCPTWRTTGGMSAAGVAYWAWRGIKVKAWPNCVLSNKDQLGHRKGGWRGNTMKIILASPGRMRVLRGSVQVLGPGICDGGGLWGTSGS